MQKLLSYMRAAVQDYDMIKSGDNIAIGVSGGKDSLALLCAMARLRSFYPEKFDITAITIDMRFNDTDGDFSRIEALCRDLDVAYKVVPTNLYRLIFEARQESNPCSLCSKMRRGALNKAAKAAGCNKVALGHHLDDVAETFIMNLFNGASLDCFMPVTYLDRSDITVIRPMIYARESDCARITRREGLPVTEIRCPADGNTEREEVKAFLSSLEKKYGNVREKILNAMQKKEINGY